MTTSKSTIKLLNWFNEHDSFSADEDLNKIENLKDDSDRVEAAYGCALLNLEKSGIIKKFTKSLAKGKTKEIWVLESPLSSLNQEITCSMNVAVKVSETINNFLLLIDSNNNNQSDPSNLGEADIIAILSIIEVMANKLKELQSDE